MADNQLQPLRQRHRERLHGAKPPGHSPGSLRANLDCSEHEARSVKQQSQRQYPVAGQRYLSGYTSVWLRRQGGRLRVVGRLNAGRILFGPEIETRQAMPWRVDTSFRIAGDGLRSERLLQRSPKLRWALESVRRNFLHGSHDALLNPRGNFSARASKHQWRSSHMRSHQIKIAVALEWQAPAQKLIERDPEAIDV